VKLLGVDSCAAKESPRQTHRYRVVVLTSSPRCVKYVNTVETVNRTGAVFSHRAKAAA
jgi:hypothetical protein